MKKASSQTTTATESKTTTKIHEKDVSIKITANALERRSQYMNERIHNNKTSGEWWKKHQNITVRHKSMLKHSVSRFIWFSSLCIIFQMGKMVCIYWYCTSMSLLFDQHLWVQKSSSTLCFLFLSLFVKSSRSVFFWFATYDLPTERRFARVFRAFSFRLYWCSNMIFFFSLYCWVFFCFRFFLVRTFSQLNNVLPTVRPTDIGE